MTEDKSRDQDHHVRGYERMLDRLRAFMEQAGEQGRTRLRDALEAARDKTVELGELTREEADRIAGYLQRDVEEAAQYSATTDDDLSGWLQMDLQLVENWVWDRFASVADRTRLEWIELQHQLQRAAEYHTGEIAGPGALVCDGCGETLQYSKPGRIPPCPRCHGTVYRRPVSADESGAG